MQPPPPLQPTLWRTCRVLANRRRLRILKLLAGESRLTVSTVARRLHIPLPATSQCLRALESRGLLRADRHGGRVFYAEAVVQGSRLARVLRALRWGFRRKPGFAEAVFGAATAFTHPRRIALYRALLGGDQTPAQLRRITKVSRFALARHLMKLKARGLVRHVHGCWQTVTPADAFLAALADLAAG